MESSKLLRPLTRSTKRVADEFATQSRRKWARLKDGDEGSCEVCGKFNFVAFFTSERKPIVLCSATHILNCLSCPLCKHISSALSQIPGPPSDVMEGELELVQDALNPRDYLLESGLEQSFRLDVRLHTNERFSRLLTTLEMCHGLPQPLYPYERMVRVPREECFAPGLLLEWPANAEEENIDAQIRRCSIKTSPIEDLSDLIDHRILRVLNVHSGEVVVLDSAKRYVALSYVWGKYAYESSRTQQPLPGQSTHVTWIVDLDAEPATIRDAAFLVRLLGEQYLWIDSLCIDQSDPLDKARIVSRMDLIYRYAYLTIVAADGDDAHAGLQRLHRHPEHVELPIKVLAKGRRLSFLPTQPNLESTLQKTVWNTRGWTYQEMMLSSKTVFFTSAEVFFTTLRIQEREIYSVDRNFEKGSTVRKRKGWQRSMNPSTQLFVMLLTQDEPTCLYDDVTTTVAKAYAAAVHEYTNRSLSYEDDRFNAFSGILNSFAARTLVRKDGNVFGGIAQFENHVGRLFSWTIAEASHRTGQHNSNTQALPSWSWVGWSGVVRSAPGPQFTRISVMDEANIGADLKHYETFPDTAKPYNLSPREGIVLHLWAPILRCKLAEIKPPGDHHKPPRTHSYYSITPETGRLEVLDGFLLLDKAFVSSPGSFVLPKSHVELPEGTVPCQVREPLYPFFGIGKYDYKASTWKGHLIMVKRCPYSDFVERACPSTVRVQIKKFDKTFREYRHIMMCETSRRVNKPLGALQNRIEHSR